MASKLHNAVIETLSYSSVFEYPLTIFELYIYLIGYKLPWKKFYLELPKIPDIEIHGNFVILRGDRRFISQRIERKKISQQHLQKSQRIISCLGLIPSIRCIGVSGSLAMNNSVKESDVDLCIITSRNTLWLTRVIVSGVLFIAGKKRSRGASHAAGKICTNMWISEQNLRISKKNLFTAHEVVQLKVVVNKNKMYERFLHANTWVKKYLPQTEIPILKARKISSIGRFLTECLRPCEWLAFQIQNIYMKKNRTVEKVSITGAEFHPHDLTEMVLQKYNSIQIRHKKKPVKKVIRYGFLPKYSGILT